MKARWDVAFADGTQELYSLEVEQVDIPTIIPPTPEAKAVEIDIWVEGGEGATYYDGDELILCYEVSRPVDVRIYQCPSGQACAIFTQVGNSDGGRCFQEHLDLPIGVTTYRVEASDDGEIAAEAETYIYVDQPPQPTGESPDESLIIYYNLVSDGRYEEAWARLSPSFQENMHSDGFASYVEYYEDLGAWGVWVEDVQIVEQDGHDAVVAAVLVFDWGSTSTVKHYKIDYHMVYDSSRELWLIDRTVRK